MLKCIPYASILKCLCMYLSKRKKEQENCVMQPIRLHSSSQIDLKLFPNLLMLYNLISVTEIVAK